jgi:hypothetical protein
LTYYSAIITTRGIVKKVNSFSSCQFRRIRPSIGEKVAVVHEEIEWCALDG